MPDMTPLGNQIIPPDPQKGLGLMSSILGIQQQRQALQTGQYTQQTAQAESTQKQQQSNELQAAQTLAKNGVSSGAYTKTDGTFDRQKMADDIAKVAPTYGQGVANQLLSGANEVVSNKRAVQGLNQDQQGQLSGMLQGLATKKDLTNSDVVDAYNAMADINPTPEFRRMLMSNAMHFPQNASSQQLQQMVQTQAAQLSGQTQQSPSTVDTGAQIQPGATNRYTGGFAPAGAPIAKQLGPSEQIPYVAERTSATSRATGTAGSDIDRSNEVSGLQQQSSAAIPLTQRIDELSHEINSGHLAKMLSESGNYLGFSSINEARSQLNKDLGQVKGLAVAKAGSDSRAATVLEGYPTDTTPESTTHAAMDYIRGTARQNLARGKLLSQYQKDDPQGLKGFQAADNVLSGKTNPLMHEYLALKPADQAGFYRRNFSSPQEAQAFKDEVGALKKHTRVFD
jgi:hypothetical protein